MLSLISSSKAHKEIALNMRQRRLQKGYTQEGLAERAGVSLPSLRRFEQKGLISLTSFFNIALALDCLEEIVVATKVSPEKYTSIDDVLEEKKENKPKRGWRK